MAAFRIFSRNIVKSYVLVLEITDEFLIVLRTGYGLRTVYSALSSPLFEALARIASRIQFNTAISLIRARANAAFLPLFSTNSCYDVRVILLHLLN